MVSFHSRVFRQLFPTSSTRTRTKPGISSRSVQTKTISSCPSYVRPNSVPHHMDSESGLSPERQTEHPISNQHREKHTQRRPNTIVRLLQHPGALRLCDAIAVTWRRSVKLCRTLQPTLPDPEGGGRGRGPRGDHRWCPLLSGG